MTVTFAFFKLNRVAMCFVFINVALLMRDVDDSCSQLTKKFSKTLLLRIRTASQLVKAVASLLTSF